MLLLSERSKTEKGHKLHDYNYDVLKRGSYTDKKISVLAGAQREGKGEWMDHK